LKAYNDKLLNSLQFLAILLLLIVFSVGCSSVKYIGEHQAIVKSAEIDGVDKAYEESAYNYIQKDIRPLEGLKINVLFYNLFNTKNGKYKTANLKSIGTPPPLLDSTLVEISRSQIEKFLKSKGFFNASVSSDIRVHKKKASLHFNAQPGAAYSIHNVSTVIPDTSVAALYRQNKAKFSHLRAGMQYDEDSLVHELDELYKLLRRNGYADFVKPYVRFELDSNQTKGAVNVKMIVDNPINGNQNHTVYRFGQSDLVIAPNSDGFNDSMAVDSAKLRNNHFVDFSNHFRYAPIGRYNFLKNGQVYDMDKESLSYERLYALNVFKSVKIEYRRNPDSPNVVNPLILLTPQKQMSNRLEGEIPFNSATVGFTLSNTYVNNNIFRGGERFQFQIKGGLQSRLNDGKAFFSDIYQRDFSLSASLTIPRLMLPFRLSSMGKNGMPYTTFSSSYLYALQKGITIRRVFISSVAYDWVETKSKLHSFTPLNFEYRFGSILIDTLDKSDPIKYQKNKELIENNSYNIALLGRKDVTLGLKYAYSLNANRLAENQNFVYLRANIDMAGNLMQGLTHLLDRRHNPSAGDFGLVMGLPFNQYVRPEIDLRWYRRLGLEAQFVARISAGVGYAYGNSLSMPFEKLFYAGGSSGVRAWQARTLGPGNYNREVIPSAEARAAAYGIDQLGQMRLEANLEYRFLLFRKFFGGKLNGATFIDAGNIWNIAPGNPQTQTYFDFKNLGNQIGLGTGLGFRYDVQFFIFRFDVGLKLKDPQFPAGQQWVINHYFNGGKSFKSNYYLTHSPERYRFVQYNFGIGMPF
jgi:outer membrane translocation and assembly module TamA